MTKKKVVDTKEINLDQLLWLFSPTIFCQVWCDQCKVLQMKVKLKHSYDPWNGWPHNLSILFVCINTNSFNVKTHGNLLHFVNADYQMKSSM